MSPRKLLITHKSPDLDAVGAIWMLKRFDNQHFGHAKISFVNAGQSLNEAQAQELGYEITDVTHVDTGLGDFDHHQPERGQLPISATSLTYEHVCKVHPDYVQDQALRALVDLITQIDHFGEVNWPEAGDVRYNLMIHELIRGFEFTDPQNDDAQLHFGLQCLDNAYAIFVHYFSALESIKQHGMPFDSLFGKSLAIESRNDAVLKLAQKQGYMLVIRKDPHLGNVRIKLHPNSNLDLSLVRDAVLQVDKKGSWYYHPGGRMFLNGSSKNRDQQPSPLPLAEFVAIIKNIR